jgi:L-asparaginase
MPNEPLPAARISTKVLVLYTGGTIGMVPSIRGNPASPLKPAPKEDLIEYVPNPLDRIAWDIVGLLDDRGDIVGPLDSSSVGPRHWVYMANAIEESYGNYDGFVILHGTDTMAYTASALSFLLQNLSKPVIITGSQLPIFQPRTDAVLNFINSLYIAGYRATNLPRVPEVAICFGDALLRGNRTTKISTSRWQGFDTPNYSWLGRIGEHIAINKSLLRPVPNEELTPFFAHKLMQESVATIPLYPGMAAEALDNMLNLSARGFILRSFGAGNAPEDVKFLTALRKAVDSGKIVVNTTQCLEGTVEMGLYEASSGLQAAGVITGLDLTPEAALTKLMWLLASEEDASEVSTQMQIDQRGEQSGSVFEIDFGSVGAQSADVVQRISGTPSGRFQTKMLTRAMLRLTGVHIADLAIGEPIQISVFVNLPSANSKTSDKAPQFAGYLAGEYTDPEKTVLVRDITSTLARVHEAGRPVHLSFVSPLGKKFFAEGAFLTLFNESERAGSD